MNHPQNTATDAAPLTIREKRIILAQMVRGQRKSTRIVKTKDRIVEVEEELSNSLLLRALALDEKLAKQERAEAAKQAKKQPSTTGAATVEERPATAPAMSLASAPHTAEAKPLSKKQRIKMAQRARAAHGANCAT